MELKKFEKFNGLLDELLWYPKTFLLSEAGVRWDKVPSRHYYSTPWMDFFLGLNDGSINRLAKEISSETYTTYFTKEIESRILPLIDNLQHLPTEKGMHKILVYINIEKFRLYEEKLKKMSADDVIFDIIRDDSDIRDQYEIHVDPSQIRSFLLVSLHWVHDNFVSFEQKKIKTLEKKIEELQNALIAKDTLVTLANEQQRNFENKAEEARKELEVSRQKIEHLEESLVRFMDDELTAEPESTDIRENSKLRMYYLYKLGFLDDSIWNGDIPQKARAQIIGTILDAGPLKADTAIRYYKFFNSTGSAELREYDSKNEERFFDYIRKKCPGVEFKKGQTINRLRKI